MLYKMTPVLAGVEAKKSPAEPEGAPKQGRKRRKSAVFDAEGHEVLITMMCLKCRQMRPLAMFGLRKMADGAIRNQPWCRSCRSGASSKKKPAVQEAEQLAPAAVIAGAEPHPGPAQTEAPKRTEPLTPLEELMAAPGPI